MFLANEQIINFIWDMIFTLVASGSIIGFLMYKNKRIKEIIKTNVLLLFILIINIIIGIITKINLGILLLGYEIICWILIIDSIIIVLNKKKIKIDFNKTEKILMTISILIGLVSIIILINGNILYISPMKNNTYIGNYYFNADTHRSIVQISSANEVTHKIHPLYRFIVLPIMLPLIIINELLISTYYLEIFSAYFICLIQIICNAISALLMYKILKKENLKQSICTVGTLIFICSLSIIWTSILPETYAITTVTMLIFIYLYQKKNIFCVPFAILTIGSNIMAMVPIGLIILTEIIKNIKAYKKYIPIILIIAIISTIIIMPYLYEYISEWMYQSKTLSETFTNSINYFLIPLLYGPSFIKNGSLFVQINIMEKTVALLWVVFCVLSVIGYISNHKKIIPNICLGYLAVAYILHVILGYGFANGILYSPLYCWPFIILISNGIDYIYNKITCKKTFIIILITIILSLPIYNFRWLFKIQSYLKDEKFNTSNSQNYSLYKYLQNDEYFETFFYNNEAIYRCSDGKKIIDNIDQYMMEGDYIVGLLKDSNWFKIYFENNELKVNISNQIKTIDKDYFYIFGMGLRKKYILTKLNNSEYKLMEYNSKEEVLSNIIIENIDYENYTVYCDNNIIIYENEYGIYINKNGQTQVLDDSVYINIPKFTDYEHKEQLKILFNEVMVNITEDGPKPNFMAYDGVWYRDATIIAKVLEETNNLEQITTWINNINKIYDEQNGVKEADNLGQVLYLISLTENRNQEIIQKILQEAEKLRTEEGYIEGITDGNKHPVYQTKWLIYGMEKLGIKNVDYKVPDIIDNYAELLWFDRTDDTSKIKYNDRWQYLYYANMHYNKKIINYKNTLYPISNEIYPSKANIENMSVINDYFVEAKIVTPHAWSAAEMFLYLLDLDRGNL